MRILRTAIIGLLLASGAVASAQEPLRQGPWGAKVPLRAECVWQAHVWEGGAWKESVVAKRLTELYSPEGLLESSELCLYSGGVFESSVYRWRGGRLALVTVRDGSKRLLRTTRYEYEEPAKDGSFVRTLVTADASDITINIEREHLDPSGRLLSAEGLEADGNVLLERIYEYDEKGRCIREEARSGGALIWERNGSYGEEDEAGNWRWFRDYDSCQGMQNWPRHVVRRTLFYAEAGE